MTDKFMQILVNDRKSYSITQREYTDEGFLRVPGNVARSGVQEYLASELRLPGNPNRIVKVYRPPEEVFNSDSLSSYDGVDITINHPDGLVNSKNFKKVSVGFIRGDGRRTDNDHVECDHIIKAQEAIDAVNSGKCELSAGYTAVYDHSPGVTTDGEEYEYIQRNIRINHVAIVDRARAGATARIFDNHPTGGNIMPVMITTDSGRSIDVADTANAQLVADAFDRLSARVTTAEAAQQTAQAIADSLTAQMAELKNVSSDAAITARVKEIATCQITARKICGKDFMCDSADPIEIMRSALSVKMPKRDWADKAAAYIQASFDMAVEAEEEEEEETKDSSAQLAQVAADAARCNPQNKPSPYELRKAQLSNAWKGVK
jgi:hypothetical protein